MRIKGSEFAKIYAKMFAWTVAIAAAIAAILVFLGWVAINFIHPLFVLLLGAPHAPLGWVAVVVVGCLTFLAFVWTITKLED